MTNTRKSRISSRTRTRVAAALVVLLGTSCGGAGPEPGPAPTTRKTAYEAFNEGMALVLSDNADRRREGVDCFRERWGDLRDLVAGMRMSPSFAERHAATYLLSELGTDVDIEVLRHFLGDSEPMLRVLAVQALLRLRDPGLRERVPALLRNARYEEARDILTLVSTDWGSAAWGWVIAAAGDEDWALRRAGAQALSRHDRPEAVARLEELLRDPVWWVRQDAAESLGLLRATGSRPELVALLDDSERPVRGAVATALGRLGGEEDFETLRRLADDDPNKAVRIAATRALVHWDSAIGVEVLLRIQRDGDRHRKVRNAAIDALCGMDCPEAAAAIRGIVEDDYERCLLHVRDVLRSGARERHPMLIGDLLLDDDPEVRAVAIDALEQRPQRNVAFFAATALVGAGDGEERERLRGILARMAGGSAVGDLSPGWLRRQPWFSGHAPHRFTRDAAERMLVDSQRLGFEHVARTCGAPGAGTWFVTDGEWRVGAAAAAPVGR